ncbi:MAG: DUF1559 domain-containing protein, partial [Planctomycetota bacterium]
IRRTWQQFRGSLIAGGSVMESEGVTIAKITDGTSKSVLVGEYHTTTSPGIRKSVWASPFRYHSKGHLSRDDNNESSVYRLPDVEFCERQPSTRTIPPTPGGGGDPFLCWRAFATVHAGGTIQFVFCDGSVRGVSELIDDNTYLALGTIGGGENVNEF